MGCATTSRRFEREMLFTPRSTLRENLTVVLLDVKKDRTPHTSAKRRPAAQVDLHKHRSCRLWLQPAQRTDSPTTHASPRTTRSAKRASPRNAARKGAVHVHDGLPPLRHRRPDRLHPEPGACSAACGRCGGRRRERSRGWSEGRAAAAAPPPPATIVRGSPPPPGAGSAVRLAAAQRRRA